MSRRRLPVTRRLPLRVSSLPASLRAPTYRALLRYKTNIPALARYVSPQALADGPKEEREEIAAQLAALYRRGKEEVLPLLLVALGPDLCGVAGYYRRTDGEVLDAVLWAIEENRGLLDAVRQKLRHQRVGEIRGALRGAAWEELREAAPLPDPWQERRFWQAFLSLPEEHQWLLAFSLDGRAKEKIAADFGITPSALSHRLQWIRQRLSRHLQST